MVLVFDVWSDVAMFRKPYTTTSQVSFAVPPPTALAGLVAAIVGIDHGAHIKSHRSDFWTAMKGSRLAFNILQPIQWYSTALNLLKFKTPNGDITERIQSKHQMLKKPRYRVYFQGGIIYSELKRRLEKDEFVFTPYLGVAYALANISYLGEYSCETVDEVATWVDSVVPLYNDVQIDVLKGRGLHKEKVPFQMNSERELQRTVTVIYPEIVKDDRIENNYDNRIWLKNKGQLEICQVGKERVAWFERWSDL